MDHIKQENITRTDIVNELLRELAMRRKVWQKVPNTQSTFYTLEHQRQYNALDKAYIMLQFMTEKEFQTIQDRIERHIQDAKAQTSLFE